MTSKPNRQPGIQTRSLIDGYVVVFSETTNQASTLTPLAGIVWEFCDGSNSVDDIVQELQSIKEISAEVDLKTQVQELVNEFIKTGLVFAGAD